MSPAIALLQGEEIDDLNGGKDALKGYISLLHGEDPVIESCVDLEEECARLVAFAREAPYPPEEIAIVAREHWMLRNHYGKALEEAGTPHQYLEREGETGGGIRLASMHRVKGLEFTCVWIAGLSETSYPPAIAQSREDESTRAELLLREKSLLYVAMTRAKRELHLSAAGVMTGLVRRMG